MREAEYKRKLIEYIKKNVKKGYPLESLKWSLVQQGYSRTLVDMAMKESAAELAREAPVLREKPVITHEIVPAEPEKKKGWFKRFFGLD